MYQVLTDRESQIIELITNGLTNKEISCKLSISESTVENHVHHIFVKIGVSNRVQAAVYAISINDSLIN